MDILNSSISRQNRIPAIGALNIPATAPAAPQQSRMVICRYDSPRERATFEPIAAPVYTIGASAPTEPPKPIVTELDNRDDHILWLLIRELLRDMENRTFVTPCPISSLTTYRTNRSDKSIPTPG